MRRTLPLTITFVVGMITIINSIIIAPAFNKWVQDYLARTITVSGAWAVALGAINLLRIHGTRIQRKREGTFYSIILCISFFAILILGIYLTVGYNKLGTSDPIFQYFYNSLNVPLNSTMFSVLCFYIASAAYRAFRLRSVEATVLLLSATIVMLGVVPIGRLIFNGFGPDGILGFPWMKEWIMNQANTSVMRGLALGITLGAVAQATRNLLGIERGYMSGE
ncbi:MAG: hypothetical protein ACM3ZQ_05630 [Bacillota bacterium]